MTITPPLTLESMIQEVRMWRTEKLGEQPPLAHAAKICEEAGELVGCEIAAVDRYSSDGDPVEEAADVLVALIAYCDRVGINLTEAWLHKMRELWVRET